MQCKNNKIDIIISWRIGDAISTIPLLICLNQLNEKYGSNLNFTVVMQPYLYKLFSPLNILKCKSMNFTTKFKSHIFASSKAFFLETTSKNYGYYSLKTYGVSNSFKRHLTFSEELPSLILENTDKEIPNELLVFLKEKCKLSNYSISLFGVCLKLGYSVDQIIKTFQMQPLGLNKFSQGHSPLIEDKYVVFCMEAANSRKGDAYRCWDEKYYFEIAEKCYQELNLKSAFIGTNIAVKIPQKDYLIDLRKKLNLFEVAQILKSSEYYIGNDTGPLHIANIMQTLSIGVYFREASLSDFSTVFPELNTKVLFPQSSDEVYFVFKTCYSQNL